MKQSAHLVLDTVSYDGGCHCYAPEITLLFPSSQHHLQEGKRIPKHRQLLAGWTMPDEFSRQVTTATVHPTWFALVRCRVSLRGPQPEAICSTREFPDRTWGELLVKPASIWRLLDGNCLASQKWCPSSGAQTDAC